MHSSKLFLEASALLLCWALVQATPAALQALDDSAEAQERLFFSIVPQLCTGPSGKGGVCRSSLNCASRGQVGDGRCGWLNFGVCCVDRTTTTTPSPFDPCNLQTSDLEFTFRNPNYPSAETEPLGNCTVTLTTDSNTCQLRLDFKEFTLANPDNEGVCVDYLDVQRFKIPKICGENSGQHLHVEVSPEYEFNITMVAPSGGEKWDITVTQIACNAGADKAKKYCSQYYRTPTGTVTSFNYQPSSEPGTRQIADLDYYICLERLPGYCNVTYTQAPGSSFSVSGDPQALAPGVTGPPAIEDDCAGDYLFITGSTIDDNSNFADPKPTKANNFCGLSFPDTTHTEFDIGVRTDSDEISAGDSNNEGFQLSYKMNLCEPQARYHV